MLSCELPAYPGRTGKRPKRAPARSGRAGGDRRKRTRRLFDSFMTSSKHATAARGVGIRQSPNREYLQVLFWSLEFATRNYRNSLRGVLRMNRGISRSATANQSRNGRHAVRLEILPGIRIPSGSSTNGVDPACKDLLAELLNLMCILCLEPRPPHQCDGDAKFEVVVIDEQHHPGQERRSHGEMMKIEQHYAIERCNKASIAAGVPRPSNVRGCVLAAETQCTYSPKYVRSLYNRNV